jgi:asparagine N-glycosylation enzyme membrane subunit Stt3
MNIKILTIIMIIGIFLVSGCTQQESKVIQTGEIVRFNYTRDNETFTSLEYKDMNDAVEWIKQNTPQDSIFLNWWDYGHVIRGQAEREAIVWEPSKEILFTVAKYAAMSNEEREKVECPQCNPHDRIMDVVNALIAEDPSETIEIMSKYNATYLLVNQGDRTKSYVIFLVSDKDPADYVTTDYKPKETALTTTLFKAINGEEIEGLELAYTDDSVNIYEKIE